MRIFVTGGSGWIASAAALTATGAEAIRTPA
ncbi:nucleoside-diphosphate-sugar epimerase [Kutzneria kofuensis]|jgi:hypothetical protein|uniref:Nucleoside-diphosphate-sugar epimerase n=1 Tax=Kutzneria kofuensis TaxID=103725 RepID=A0A7W9KP24_9PSEU|nr:nucleoside-diphosphate-sugar epimerase [Kutzneria kofuensis]